MFNDSKDWTMNRVGQSLFVFGLYMIFIGGIGFIFMLTFILDMLSLKYGDDTWTRFVGQIPHRSRHMAELSHFAQLGWMARKD